jgi:uncharacterized protein (TIGR04255 family)
VSGCGRRRRLLPAKLAHPSFPNPTIQEAVCEIRFRRSAAWGASLFGEFYKSIQAEFPDLEPVTVMAVQLQIGPGAVGQALTPPQQMMRYKSAKGDALLQLAPDMLTVNALPKYPGWDVMKERILSAWREASKVLNPEAITRIGLRYINRLDREMAGQRPGIWLKTNDYIPQAILISESGFLSRLETRPTDTKRVVVTVGEADATDVKAIILDIDCMDELERSADPNVLKEPTEELHETAWNIFEASLTQKLRAHLEGKSL